MYQDGATASGGLDTASADASAASDVSAPPRAAQGDWHRTKDIGLDSICGSICGATAQ